MQAKQQIIMAHYSLPPVIGGVESALKPLSEIFAKHDCLVTLLTGTGSIEGKNLKTSIVTDLNPDSPHVREIQRVLRFGSLPEFYEYRMQILQRRIEAEIGNINTVMIHNIMTMPFNLTATEAFWNYIQKYPDKKYYLWTHDMAWLIEEHKPYLYDRKPWSLLKTPLPNVTYITVSEFRKRQLAELLNIPRRRIKVIPNVIKYQDFLKFDEVTTPLIENLNLFSRYPIVLIPARIIPRKNVERSLQIIARLKRHYPGIIGIVTGTLEKEGTEWTPYSQKLLDLIASEDLRDSVVFLGDVFTNLQIPQSKNRSVVRDLYFISHLVLYPSLDEGFGLPILEAGIARIPLVLAQIPVFREVAKEGVLYLPFDESVEYNADRIVNFLTENQSHSDILFNRVLTHYNWGNLWDSNLKSLLND